MAPTVPDIAVNVPLLDPAEMVTFDGTLKTLRLLDRLTVVKLVAVFVIVTVQVAFCPEPSEFGVQFNAEICRGPSRDSEKVRVIPLALAVITAVWLEDTAATLAVNLAEVDPEPTVTLPVVVRLALSSDSVTANPPAGAAPLRVTVQVEYPGPFTLAGAQLIPLNDTVVAKSTVAVVFFPFQPAVTRAVWLVLIVPAVAWNVPLLDPAPIVTLAGTVNPPKLLDRLTVAGLVAAFVKLTVQVEFWPEFSVRGVQLNEDNCGRATSDSEKILFTPLALAVITAL